MSPGAETACIECDGHFGVCSVILAWGGGAGKSKEGRREEESCKLYTRLAQLKPDTKGGSHQKCSASIWSREYSCGFCATGIEADRALYRMCTWIGNPLYVKDGIMGVLITLGQFIA